MTIHTLQTPKPYGPRDRDWQIGSELALFIHANQGHPQMDMIQASLAWAFRLSGDVMTSRIVSMKRGQCKAYDLDTWRKLAQTIKAISSQQGAPE